MSNYTPDLPMSLWLLGDEPHFSEFLLSADDVMQELGIKRSRLNQISGRDLRVARARVGRYVRPLYRSGDVAVYKDWTRATATHQKSSTALNEAAHKLEVKTQEVAGQVRSHQSELMRQIDEGLQFFNEKNLKNSSTEHQKTRDQLGHSHEDLLRTVKLELHLTSEKLKTEILKNSHLETFMVKMMSTLQGIESANAQLARVVTELSERCNIQFEELKTRPTNPSHVRAFVALTRQRLMNNDLAQAPLNHHSTRRVSSHAPGQPTLTHGASNHSTKRIKSSIPERPMRRCAIPSGVVQSTILKSWEETVS